MLKFPPRESQMFRVAKRIPLLLMENIENSAEMDMGTALIFFVVVTFCLNYVKGFVPL